MPPINPRTRKFRGIIKDINSKIEESPEINETTSIRVAQDPSPSSSITGVQRKQYFRNRNSSSSSCSSRQSTRDFSPASDDDKEYKPSSLDNSSSQESDNETRTQNIKLPKKVCQQQNLVSGSQSQFSSYNSLTQKETLSSGTAPGSSSSSSSSRSSTSSTSSSSSNSSSDSEQNSVAPSKRKCVTMNQETDIEIIISKSTEYLSSLQQIALQYDSNSSSDINENVIKKCTTSERPITEVDNSNNYIHNLDSYYGETQILSFHDNQINATVNGNSEVAHDPANFIYVSSPLKQSNPTFYNPLSLKSIVLEQIKNIQTAAISDLTPDEVCQNDSNGQTRKRKRGSKKALAKTLRNMGLKYTSSSTKHKVITERKIGVPCNNNCRLKCSNNFSEEERKEIFCNYWRMGSLTQQRYFISKHMSEIKPKYQYKKISNNRKPKHSFYLTINNQKKKVCKIFFKRTLGINDRPIRTVIEKFNSTGIIEPELRGKHKNHGTKVSAELLATVKRHIDSIPRIESHYLRQQTSREYIEGGKTLTDLYRDYKKDCEKNGSDYVKINIYRKVFKEDFNISFFTPKKDRCEDCVAYENALQPDKEKLEEKYISHLKEKELSRAEKLRDKEFISENNIVACYDMQAMLQVPRGDVSSFYYKSRLNCMNFTICELKADNTDCFFWNEVEGQKGANEIGTCIFKFLEKKSASLSGKVDIIFYSDNAYGQNKNQFVFSTYIHAVKNLPNINSIIHKFLIKGHTQNEGDSVHSTIERQIKRMLRAGPIYVPDQYINAIREAKKKGNKYNVVEMSHKEFYDIKKIQEYKLTKNTEGAIVKVSDIKIIKIEKGDSNNNVRVYYKESYSEENYKEIKLIKIPRARPQLLPLYTSKLPLSDNKKKDLKDLIKKNAILPYYVSSFYNHIL
ncbi:uncharacterized protein LOC132903927 [Amyelois transitella]|uniref:uncharacterized protein LOC132903927 n=1 Tax=Amyelois transitella TaxID=680683 RepID=UPI0029906EDB|nr:uncharacterized protein LOC132903927 [Amyelois transitella]